MRHSAPALFLAIACALPFSANATESAPATEVMILATYHMDNPGKDVANATADDVLSGKRQKQIADVVAGLAAFRPTVVAVESDASATVDFTDGKYSDFAAGKLRPSRNEVVQLGFRLAQRVGLKSVFGIDVNGDLPIEELQKFAEKNGQSDILASAMGKVQGEMSTFATLLKTETVAGLLRHMNDPAFIASGNAFYREMLKIGRGNEQPGAVLVTAWEDRNTQICARLMQVTKPGDRVVVVYGAGHSFPLRRCVSEMPGYHLVEATSYIQK